MKRYVDEKMSRQRMPSNEYGEPYDKPLDLRELANKFWRRKKLFLYVAIPLFVYLAVKEITKPYSPVYRATFDVGVANERPIETVFSSGRGADMPTVQIGAVTQRVISSLLSVNLAEKVVERLSLYAFIEGSKSDLKVDAIIKDDFSEPLGPLKLKIYNSSVSIFKEGERSADSIFGQVSIYKDGEKVADGLLNEYIDLGFCEIKITALNKNALSKTYEFTLFPRYKMAFALRNSVSIRVLEADQIEKEFGSSGVPVSGEGASEQLVVARSLFPGMSLIGILRIDVYWGNQSDALRIADGLSQQILLEDRSAKVQQYMQSKAFLDSQLVFYQGNLNKLEDQIRRFKESKNITDLTASTNALIAQVSQLEARKNELQIEQNILSDLSAYLARPTGLGDDVPNYGLTILSDEVLRRLYSDLLQTEAELKGRLNEYSNNHPKVMEVRARLSGLKEQLKEEAQKRMSSVRTEIASYNSQIGFVQGKLDNVPLDEVTLARLERDRETAEQLYMLFAEKLEETRVQEAAVTSDLKIINPPMVSSSPVNTRGRMRGGIISLVIALMAGTFAVFLVEYLDNSIKDPESAMKKVGLPLFESIPAVEDESDIARKKKLAAKLGLTDAVNFINRRFLGRERKRRTSDGRVKLLGADMNSPEFEAFRKLVVNLDFAHPYKKYRVLYITSSGPEEGKTFLALNLGYVIGNMGKRVMMIDTDFRKKAGHLTEVTRLKKELGLFDVLLGYVEPQDVALPLIVGDKSSRRLENKMIDLLPVGKIPRDPFSFLESEKMKDLINNMKETYDYLVIDGTPLLLFADAAYLANYADGVLLTARYGKTTVKELENSRDILMNARCNIIGVVMNDVPKNRGSYYYHHYYKYYSKYYKTEKT